MIGCERWGVRVCGLFEISLYAALEDWHCWSKVQVRWFSTATKDRRSWCLTMARGEIEAIVRSSMLREGFMSAKATFTVDLLGADSSPRITFGIAVLTVLHRGFIACDHRHSREAC